MAPVSLLGKRVADGGGRAHRAFPPPAICITLQVARWHQYPRPCTPDAGPRRGGFRNHGFGHIARNTRGWGRPTLPPGHQPPPATSARAELLSPFCRSGSRESGIARPDSARAGRGRVGPGQAGRGPLGALGQLGKSPYARPQGYLK